MDIYYCPEQKNKYIALLMPAGKKEADNLFRKSCRTENSLGKDVCRFQLSELQNLFVTNNWDLKYGTLKVRVSTVRKYIEWCISNDIDGILVNPDQISTNTFRTERTKKEADFSEYYSSYEDLIETANRALTASGMDHAIKKTCLLLCSLCFLGFKLNEIAIMRFSDIDFESGVFSLPKQVRDSGISYQVTSKDVSELAKECYQIYVNHFSTKRDFRLITNLYNQPVYSDVPVKNPAWTTKTYWNRGIGALRLDAAPGDEPLNPFNHSRISLSGQYSRIYDEIGDPDNYTDEIAKKYIRAKTFYSAKRYEFAVGYRKWYQYFFSE
ncbi:hypothetical protein [Bacteroides acidifaciens]|uniref:phage lytic cycle repressor MrpR family protein n=1 Tax=Bacteroides acidifaciens TaxID=85831 RepID=UPI00248B3CDD|nr:hypothetical protein [Bacteroides acidifaciens]